MTNAHGFTDIKYNVAYEDMTAKIAINRPELHNAFRPITVNEIRRALDLAQDDRWVGLGRIGFRVSLLYMYQYMYLYQQGTLCTCSALQQ